MTKVERKGRTNPITNRLQKFEEGDLVHIIINPSIQKGQPHPRFHGKTGKVIGTKGKAYLIALKEGNKAKELIVQLENIKSEYENLIIELKKKQKKYDEQFTTSK